MDRKSIRIVSMVCTIFFCYCMCGCAQKKEYKLSVNLSKETAWGKGAGRFAELAYERSGGEINIKPYYGMVLAAGDQMREILLLQSGGIDFSLNSTINYTPAIPELNVFALPFLFPDVSAVDRAVSGEGGKMIEERIAAHNMVVLGWGENGFRELTNRLRPVKVPRDLAGMKVRVCVPIYIDIFKSLKADPTAMVWAEALTAFRKGVVDAEENPVVGVIVPYEIADYHKYLTLWHYSYDALLLSCNKDTWDHFTPKEQALLRECAREAMAYQKQLARAGLKDALRLIQDEKGAVITELSSEERSLFQAHTRPIYEKYAEQIGWELVRAFESASFGNQMK
ncbi:MAG: TRAP transporter substrate-binding protein DctP [bacterium]